MEFQGPNAADYENVHSLNRAFLALLRRRPAGTDASKWLATLPGGLSRRLAALSSHQAARLARTPFMLMSLRERDERFWAPVFAADASGDLFAVPNAAPDERGRLVAAGLAFVWQLAGHNPYAARLVCGASLHWCEQLTERTFLHVLALAGARREIPSLRCSADAGLWDKLLDAGVSREAAVRRAAHISALQCVLTAASLPAGGRLRTAACAVRAPVLRVADDDG